MASLRIVTHRRRSHSASTSASPVPRRSPDDSYRVAAKRAHPHHSIGSAYPDLSSPQKWDVDVWRRGKRRRKDLSPSFENKNIQRFGHTPPSNYSSTAPPTPTFAVTAAEFQLFPKNERNNRLRRSSHTVDSGRISLSDTNHNTRMDLTQLRSDAFWELHRSVAENGEGLVRRMRDYESSRSRSDLYIKAREAQRRGRKRASIIAPQSRKAMVLGVESDDDDDVQIFAGEVPNTQFPGSPLHTRALSLGLMDEDSRQCDVHSPPFEASERCSSPGATCDSSSSAYQSDDEELSVAQSQPAMAFLSSSPYPSQDSVMSYTPALSYRDTDSASSSLASLPLPPALSLSSSSSTSLFTPHQSLRPMTMSASRSEKAIAALSLAMANGAGGLNDYEALRAIHPSPALEECQVGEMWH